MNGQENKKNTERNMKNGVKNKTVNFFHFLKQLSNNWFIFSGVCERV